MKVYARVEIKNVITTKGKCMKNNSCPRKPHMETKVTFEFLDLFETTNIPSSWKKEFGITKDKFCVGFYKENGITCIKELKQDEYYDFTGFDLAYFENKELYVLLDNENLSIINVEVID